MPTIGDTAIIDNHTVVLDIDAEIEHITINNSSKLHGSGNLTVNGHFLWEWFSLCGAGRVWWYGHHQRYDSPRGWVF